MSRPVLAWMLTAVLAVATAWAAPVDAGEVMVWSAEPTARGLQLTGARDGRTVMTAVLPVPFSGSLRWDNDIQVAADPATGKVVMVWQRRWDDVTAEIQLAVWSEGGWERVEVLSGDQARLPRSPTVQVVLDQGDTEAAPQESFAEVLWWEGAEDAPEPRFARLRLAAAAKDHGALSVFGPEEQTGTEAATDVQLPASGRGKV